MSVGIILLKVAIAIILAASVLGVGLLPILLGGANKGCLSLMTSSAGGVLLGTVLLHLMPEVLEDGTAFKCHANITSGYPITELVIALGFLLMLFIEKSVEEARAAYGTKGEEQPLMSSSSLHDNSPGGETNSITSYNTAAADREITAVEARHVESRSEVSSYILVLALAIHSVMEGLAIGVASTVGDTLTLFLTVLLHKLCLAFAVGVKLRQDKKPFRHHLTGLMVFAVSSPIGVILGLLITNVLKESVLFIAMFFINAIATGTFMYIAFLEIIGPEFQTRHISQVYKSVAVGAGFALMALLFFFTHDYAEADCEGVVAVHTGH